MSAPVRPCPGAASRWWGAGLLLLAASIWGGMYVVSKAVLDFIPPMTLLVLRLVMAAAVLGAWARLRREPAPRGRDLGLVAVMALVGMTVSVGAQFTGTRLATAQLGALITSASPAFIVVFAALILREAIVPRTLAALAIASAGVVLVVGLEGLAGGSRVLAGNVWLLVAALSWALYSVLARAVTLKYPAAVVTASTCALGAAFTAPLAWWELRAEPWPASLPPAVWWGVAYLGFISTVVAFTCWNRGFALVEAAPAGLFLFAQPVVGTALGWLLLGESPGTGFFVGGALITAGVGLGLLTPAPGPPGADRGGGDRVAAGSGRDLRPADPDPKASGGQPGCPPAKRCRDRPLYRAQTPGP